MFEGYRFILNKFLSIVEYCMTNLCSILLDVFYMVTPFEYCWDKKPFLIYCGHIATARNS